MKIWATQLVTVAAPLLLEVELPFTTMTRRWTLLIQGVILTMTQNVIIHLVEEEALVVVAVVAVVVVVLLEA
jgi:hypothetical protein